MRLVCTSILSITCIIVIALIEATFPSDMLSRLDTHVDPCNDFYHYACGGWIKKTTVKPTETQVKMAFNEINQNNARIFGTIIREKPPLVGEFWDSCMTFELNAHGRKRLEEDLNSIVKAKTRKDILALVGRFSRTGLNAITNIVVAPDYRDSTINKVYIQPPDMTLPNVDYYSNVKLKQIESEYRAYIDEIVQLSGFTLDKRKNHVSVADIVIEIERKIAIIKKEKSGKTRYVSILREMKSLPAVIGAFVKGLGLLEKSKHDIKIYVLKPMYFEYVEKFIKSVSVDDLKVYLAFNLLHSRAMWLGKDFYQAWFKFFEHTLKGKDQPPPRKDLCMGSLLEYLPDLIGKYYYEKAFDPERYKNVNEMLKFIKKSMGEHIARYPWSEPQEREQANSKLTKVLSLIGQSSIPKSNPLALAGDYSTNIHTLLLDAFKFKIKQIDQQTNRNEWRESPASVNAYFYNPMNTMVFPAAILQPPLFNGLEVHPAQNFGAIGTIMGHELMHGFDNSGNKFDADGNKHAWWAETTYDNFKSRSQCLEKQYSSFKVKGEHGVIGTVNGTLTLNENIADNGGVALAWDAYRKYMTTIGREPTEVDDKLFFVAFGQTWCTKTLDKHMKHLLATDEHSPGHWRVNGVIMNSKAFAKVFKCEMDAPMNPIDKCPNL